MNMLNGNIRLNNFTKRKFKRHKSNLRSLVDKSVPLIVNKRIIIQQGGLLLPLFTAVYQLWSVSYFELVTNNEFRKMHLISFDHS